MVTQANFVREKRNVSSAGGHLKDINCAAQVCCINCNGAHKTLDRRCPVYLKNAEIMKRMAFDNLLFLEAKRQVEGINKERRNIPSEVT